jgi:hypothetical protein
MAHVLEPELLDPPPRPVRLRNRLEAGCLVGCLQIFILPHTVVGFFILSEFFSAAYYYVAVSRSGVDLEGRVTNKVETAHRKGPSYCLDYVFSKDGEKHAGQVYVSAEVYSAFQIGDPLPLRVYSPTPREGRWHLIPGESPGLDLAGTGFACLFWNGIVWGMYWFMYVRPWRQRNLIRHGQAAVARVTDVTSWQEKSQTVHRVRYEFNPGLPGDPPVRGRVHVRPPMTAADVTAGDELTVVYDPRRPRRNVLYRFSRFIVRVPEKNVADPPS